MISKGAAFDGATPLLYPDESAFRRLTVVEA